jgi:hypothetical protein
MLPTDEPLDAAGPSTRCTPRSKRWRTVGAYVALLAIPCGLIALVVLANVASAAGAAGGCGGG